MRRVLAILLGVSSLTLALCLALTWPPLVYAVVDRRLPGSERHDLEGLDPIFRADVEALVAALGARGHPTWVRAGLRDAERQEAWVARGYSQTRRSAHLRGNAVDLVARVPFAVLPAHVACFRALRDEAAALGLCSGASWTQRPGLWALFGLGWDPAHVEEGPCR